MKLVNYRKLSKEQLRDKYWEYEIEISKIAVAYKHSEDYIIKNKHILSVEDRHRLGVLLWEVVNCLQCYNSKKRSNVIPFPPQKLVS